MTPVGGEPTGGLDDVRLKHGDAGDLDDEAAADDIDPSTRAPEQANWWPAIAWNAVFALVACTASFFVLRPDWYFWQNGLDPLFYTGYAQNFDDILPAVGSQRYFVSRWSIYLPARAFFLAFGAEAGFVAFRIALLALAVVALWQFGRSWSLATRCLVVTTLLTSPMIVRAVYTDYSDAVVVPLGIVMICALFSRRSTSLSGVVAGVAAALMIVANPMSASIIALSFGLWCLHSYRRRWRAAAHLTVAIGCFISVVVAGLLLFRWRYGIDDVYQPTIDFIRTSQGGRDALKSPDSEWLSYRLWIYLPPITVALALLLHASGRSRVQRHEAFVVALAALQFCFQCWYQFAQDGTTLEIQYYWSYMLPAYVVAGAVVLRQFASVLSDTTVWAFAAAMVVVAVVLPTPAPSIWPTVIPALLVIIVAFAVVLSPLLGRHTGVCALALFLFVSSSLQFGSPRPEPRRAGELRVESDYEHAFGVTTSAGQRTFAAATEFGDHLDDFGDGVERHLYFWIGGAESWQLAAIYGAPVSGRAVNFDDNSVPSSTLPASWAQQIHDGGIPVVAVLGAPEQVPVFLDLLRDADPGVFEILDDTTFQTSSPTRLVLVQLVASLPSA